VSTHTPGPWEAIQGDLTGNWWVENVELDRAITAPSKLLTPANARLIAAAPELLAALKDLLARAYALPVDTTEVGLKNCAALCAARAVIAKVEGRT